MQPARSAAVRIAVGAALSLALSAFAWSGGSSNDATAYAIDATPVPASVVTPPSPASSVVTPPSPASSVPPAAVVPVAPSPAQTALQQTSDQITSVSQQITQTIQDPSTSTDSKVQLITSLAAQFNELVAIWQQQLAQTTAVVPAANTAPTPVSTAPTAMCGTTACVQQPAPPPPGVAGVQATPTPLPHRAP